ncbi:hypothetical protein BgiMline_017476, partial [Biomphalaria glabrata]
MTGFNLIWRTASKMEGRARCQWRRVHLPASLQWEQAGRLKRMSLISFELPKKETEGARGKRKQKSSTVICPELTGRQGREEG